MRHHFGNPRAWKGKYVWTCRDCGGYCIRAYPPGSTSHAFVKNKETLERIRLRNCDEGLCRKVLEE